jgi:LPS sulfotransferase NodH
MLEDIDTGYEGKFDFPLRRERPGLTYLLASVPRAGSSYFSHLLWATGCLGAPLEYLNFDPAGPYSFAAVSSELQHSLWRSVLQRRCSPNGVFGLKAFPTQLQALHAKNRPLLADVLATMLPKDRPRHIVYLRRRDRVAQTVSYARASLSGIWRKEQETAEPKPIAYSQATLEAAERGIETQEAAWEQMFPEIGVEPLRIWHEDVLADADGAARQVADYLGVSLEANAAVLVPQVEKQSPGDTQSWVERYAAEARGR